MFSVEAPGGGKLSIVLINAGFMDKHIFPCSMWALRAWRGIRKKEDGM
jgi:hypothetical protein